MAWNVIPGLEIVLPVFGFGCSLTTAVDNHLTLLHALNPFHGYIDHGFQFHLYMTGGKKATLLTCVACYHV